MRVEINGYVYEFPKSYCSITIGNDDNGKTYVKNLADEIIHPIAQDGIFNLPPMKDPPPMPEVKPLKQPEQVYAENLHKILNDFCVWYLTNVWVNNEDISNIKRKYRDDSIAHTISDMIGIYNKENPATYYISDMYRADVVKFIELLESKCVFPVVYTNKIKYKGIMSYNSICDIITFWMKTGRTNVITFSTEKLKQPSPSKWFTYPEDKPELSRPIRIKRQVSIKTLTGYAVQSYKWRYVK